MTCPHCAKEIYVAFSDKIMRIDPQRPTEKIAFKNGEAGEEGYGFGVEIDFCPSCKGPLVNFFSGECTHYYLGDNVYIGQRLHQELIYPKYANRKIPKEVPEPYRTDYIEASACLSVSPKASAALSRRILQTVLREERGIKNRKGLSKEIEEFVDHKDTPRHLAEMVDAIRALGNFAAHPLKNTSTGEIVEVEPHEAETMLDILDELFDFVFVKEKKRAAFKKIVNDKQSKVGKPLIK